MTVGCDEFSVYNKFSPHCRRYKLYIFIFVPIYFICCIYFFQQYWASECVAVAVYSMLYHTMPHYNNQTETIHTIPAYKKEELL